MDFLARIQADWLVLLIPLFSAFVGWFTNVLAVRMMFHPVEFIGIRPFLGWQGIIPANAVRLAATTNKLIMTKLLALEELFADFSAEDFAEGELAHVVDELAEEILREVAEERAPVLWQNAGEFMQGKIRENVRAEVAATVVALVGDFKENITDILDIEKTVIEAVEADRQLMGRMFRQVGDREFVFIERSGAWFGLLFGLIQMVVWLYYPGPWVLPIAGFFVGYATNWVALKLIFNPREAKQIAGMTIQGLFHKRQAQVAAEFGGLVAGKLLYPANLVKTLTSGETGEKTWSLVKERIDQLIDKYLSHPMAAMVLPPDQVGPLRDELEARIREELPRDGGLIHTFAARAVDVETELRERMAELPPDEFEGVLRPAFQADEYKLIIAGAALGFLAGVAQFVYVFS